MFGTGGKWGLEPFGNYCTFCNKSLILTKLLKIFSFHQTKSLEVGGSLCFRA